MELIEIISQHRNDFTGILQCEHCGSKKKLTTGYNDANYHNNVIPSFHCQECGMNRAGKIRE